MKLDMNYWDNFEKMIPHNMRWKEFTIIDNHILYWVTQEYFDENDLKAFKSALKALKNCPVDEAFVIPRDESFYNYDKDVKSGESAGVVNLKDDYAMMWNESFNIGKEVKIPGTEIILEKGDKVRLVSKKTEANDKFEVIYEDSNFVFAKRWFDDEHYTYRVNTKPNSKADDYVIEILVNCDWKTLNIPDDVEIKYGFKMNGTKASITEFIKVLQDSLKFADKVAAYLKVKVVNR